MPLDNKASVVSNSGANEWAWDPLISLPAVQLNKVVGRKSETLGNGTFTIYSVHNTSTPHEPATIVAVVGTEHRWEVSPATPVMKVGAQTYMMAAPPDPQHPPARWFLDGTRWRKDTAYYSVTVCEGVDDASLGLLEGILEAIAPYKESHKLADAEQPNAQEFQMAVSAQEFLDSSYSTGDGVPKRKASASEEAEAWLPVPQEDGGFALKKPKHSVLGVSQVVDQQGDTEGPAEQPASKMQRAYTSKSAKVIAEQSQRMASGIPAAAVWGSRKILEAGEGAKARTTPAAQPVQLSEGTLKRFEQTATAAGWVQRAADKVVSVVGSAAAFVASKIISSKPPRPEGAPLSNKGQVAVAAADGFVEVYAAIEEAAEVLYHSMRDSTSTVAGHKYGPDVGEVTYHSLNAAGRGLDAWWSARRLGVKAVAKTTAKVVVKNYVGNMASNLHKEPATTTTTA